MGIVKGGAEEIFEGDPMSLIEFQNAFSMINFDVWDRLGHVQTVSTPLGCENRFFIAILSKILCQNGLI